MYARTKEMMIRNIINANFDGFIHDRVLHAHNCDFTHRRRIDRRKLIGDTVLAVKTDEWGHRNYNKRDEEIRHHDVCMVYSGKWIFIGFNPENNTSKTHIKDKLNTLIATINACIDRIEKGENTELLEIIKRYC
jgi:hypothetical protein